MTANAPAPDEASATPRLRGRALVVDDDKAVRTALRVNLTKAGLQVAIAEDAAGALQHLRDEPVDVVLTDVMMPGMDGIELLEEIKGRWPETRVIVMTGHGSVENAVRAMKLGAADYIIKPISRDELLVVLERTLREKVLLAELAQLRREVADRFGFENLVGATPAMQHVYELVATVATSNALVLLTGPTGTGKELIAHAIHVRSGRRDSPFVRVNCAALPEGLLESELFGHEKGAFTGAVRQHRGMFEQADGGTLLLDEIGEIPLQTQVKLLRVLDAAELQRVGGSTTIKVDVRVIAATNRDLRDEVREGRFRSDLFYRLHVFQIRLPPLAERREDIPLLVDHFIKKYAARHGRTVTGVAPRAMAALRGHSWPGNVRELEHVVERAVILCTGDRIDHVELPEAFEAATHPDPLAPLAGHEGSLPEILLQTERQLIVEALRREKGVQARAARALGISRSNLNYRIQKLGVQVQDVIVE